MRPRRSALLGSLACAPLVGCSAYQPPAFEVLRVDELERSEEAVVLGFTLSATNPNDQPMPLQRMKYSLMLEGQQVFEGRRSAETVVRRFGMQIIELPAVVPTTEFDPQRFEQTGELRYDLTGWVEYQTPGELAEVLFDTGVRRPRASLTQRGTVDVEG